MSTKQLALLVLLLVGVAVLTRDARASSPSPDGYYRTGEAIQTANHWPFTIEVFAIWHDTKQLPAVKTRQAMIDLDVDKRFSLRMMRDVDADKLWGGLRDGFRRNGYDDSVRIDRFLSALSGTLPKGKAVWITYDSQAKVTHIVVDGGASATIDGVPFMKAAWSLWFGKSKPSDMGDALLSQL